MQSYSFNHAVYHAVTNLQHFATTNIQSAVSWLQHGILVCIGLFSRLMPQTQCLYKINNKIKYSPPVILFNTDKHVHIALGYQFSLVNISIPVGCWWLQSAVSWLQHGILVCIGLFSRLMPRE